VRRDHMERPKVASQFLPFARSSLGVFALLRENNPHPKTTEGRPSFPLCVFFPLRPLRFKSLFSNFPNPAREGVNPHPPSG